MSRRALTSTALLALIAGGALSACDSLECGPGTFRDSDRCVPSVQVDCGEGTVFQDGRCVPTSAVEPPPDPVTCGPGTRLEGTQCVADDVTPTPDMTVDTGLSDMGMGGDDMGMGESDMDAVDMAVDMAPPPPRCPPELVPGEPPADCGAMPPGAYCVTGVATEFVSGCAVPADAGLGVLVIDPVAAASGGTLQEYTRGMGVLGPGGTFAIIAAGESTQLALVIDEAPGQGADEWTRSISGISAAQPTPGQVFNIRAFASTRQTQNVWNTALGLGEYGLENSGFLIGRVLGPGPSGLAPVADARVRANSVDMIACADDAPCLRFFDDDPALTGFQPVGAGATGASGGFLMILRGGPVFQDQFIVERQEEIYAPIPGGASQGSGFHTAFVPMQ